MGRSVNAGRPDQSLLKLVASEGIKSYLAQGKVARL